MSKRGRRQSNPVHNHFKFDDITSTSICIHCEKSISEKHSTNLLAHIKIYKFNSKNLITLQLFSWTTLKFIKLNNWLKIWVLIFKKLNKDNNFNIRYLKK